MDWMILSQTEFSWEYNAESKRGELLLLVVLLVVVLNLYSLLFISVFLERNISTVISTLQFLIVENCDR